MRVKEKEEGSSRSGKRWWVELKEATVSADVLVGTVSQGAMREREKERERAAWKDLPSSEGSSSCCVCVCVWEVSEDGFSAQGALGMFRGGGGGILGGAWCLGGEAQGGGGAEGPTALQVQILMTSRPGTTHDALSHHLDRQGKKEREKKQNL